MLKKGQYMDASNAITNGCAIWRRTSKARKVNKCHALIHSRWSELPLMALIINIWPSWPRLWPHHHIRRFLMIRIRDINTCLHSNCCGCGWWGSFLPSPHVRLAHNYVTQKSRKLQNRPLLFDHHCVHQFQMWDCCCCKTGQINSLQLPKDGTIWWKMRKSNSRKFQLTPYIHQQNAENCSTVGNLAELCQGTLKSADDCDGQKHVVRLFIF